MSFLYGIIPGFAGVVFAFGLNGYWAYLNNIKKVYRILPLIELEMRENLAIINKLPEEVNYLNSKIFETMVWGIYKHELLEWWGNIIQLTEIYGLIERFPAGDQNTNRYVRHLHNIISEYLDFLEKWYGDIGKSKADRYARSIKKRQLERYLNYDVPEETRLIVEIMYKINEENILKLDK